MSNNFNSLDTAISNAIMESARALEEKIRSQISALVIAKVLFCKCPKCGKELSLALLQKQGSMDGDVGIVCEEHGIFYAKDLIEFASNNKKK